VARLPLFEKPADYAAFMRVLAEALDGCPMWILAFVLMTHAASLRPKTTAPLRRRRRRQAACRLS
jgi:hypothetical protein